MLNNLEKKTKITILILLVLAIVIGGVSYFSYYLVNSMEEKDTILENTTFCDLYIGDITKDEAKILIQSNDKLPVNEIVNVKYEDKAFTLTPNGAGITYDVDKIVEEAYQKGRDGNFFKKLGDIISHKFNFKKIDPVYKEDKDFFENTIKILAEENGIKFENFSYKLYENYASITIFDNRKSIDIDKLYSDVVNSVDKEEKNVEISIIENENVKADDIYDAIYVEPKEATIEVSDGKTILNPQQTGIVLDINEIENNLKENKKEFKVKIEKIYPKVTVNDLSGKLFKDVLGRYTSYYNDSIIGRTRNVTLSASKINGKILNSGEVFSYNQTVGKRTAAAGFSTATIYTNSGLSEELGGGICQTSSTLYNAVLYADLKIVERKNHMYTVSYVKNGLDATVVYGAIDFRFSNNRNYPIKVTAVASGGTLTVTILGTKENDNRVELYTNTVATYNYQTINNENPNLPTGKQVVTQNGANGYKVNATKVVKDGKGNIIRNEFLGTSTYKPLNKIVDVGTGAPPKEPVPPEEKAGDGESNEEQKPEENDNNTNENTSSDKEENNVDEKDENINIKPIPVE